MPHTGLLFAFVLATAVYAYVPGPAMLYVSGHTLARGRRAGLMAALGVHAGGYVHVAAAALGLSVLFEAVPTVYTAVKLVGAVYLIWLGVELWRRGGTAAGNAAAALSGRRAFLQSMAVEIFNPKTAIFFVAFLPQFTEAGAGLPLWLQLAVLGSIVNLMFSSADLVAVLVAGAVLRRFESSRRMREWAARLGGGVLMGLGVRLAVERG